MRAGFAAAQPRTDVGARPVRWYVRGENAARPDA
jgi:hypothetical protein